MQASTAMYPKTAEIIKQMPYEGTKVPVEGKKPKTVWTPTEGLNVPADATPEEAHEHFIEFTKNNLLALHDAVAPEIREGSMQWYDGANKIATDRALKYGKPVENTAGVYAALSPQMDWYKNASLGDRVMDTMHTQQDTAFTPAMWKWARTYAKGDPDTLALYRSMAPTKDSPGRTLGSINDPDTKAHWISGVRRSAQFARLQPRQSRRLIRLASAEGGWEQRGCWLGHDGHDFQRREGVRGA